MTRDELARIALRYDTAMSRAMLRALGVPVPRTRRWASRQPGGYEEAPRLMAQTHGVRGL